MNAVHCEVAYLADWLDWNAGEFRYCHRWIPCKQAREVDHVCIAVHGLGDHGGRFQDLGNQLASVGIPVQAVDLVGHGKSPGKRGRIKSYESLLDEIAWSIREAQHVWRNAEISLIGHSMGGNLVLTYASKRVEALQNDAPKDILPINVIREPKNVLAIAPMLMPYGEPLREDFFRVGCKLAQWLPNWPMRMESKPDLLTDDARVQQRYRNDRLVHRTMSIRLGIELLLKGRSLTSAECLPVVPTLLIHGTGDRLADIEGSRKLCRQSDNVFLEEIDSLHHDLLSGRYQASVYSMIERWCRHSLPNAMSHKETLMAA